MLGGHSGEACDEGEAAISRNAMKKPSGTVHIGGGGLTACGRRGRDSILSMQLERITCKRCLQIRAARMAKT